jgi:hypothetical protein
LAGKGKVTNKNNLKAYNWANKEILSLKSRGDINTEKKDETARKIDGA